MAQMTTGPKSEPVTVVICAIGYICAIVFLEGEIVVLVLERGREIIEAGFAGSSGSFSRSSRARTVGIGIEIPAPACSRSEKHQLANLDLGRIAGLAFLVLVLAILDRPVDVHALTLAAVLLDDVGETGAACSPVPCDAPMPLGFLLLLAAGRIPRPASGKRKSRDLAPVGSCPDLGIVTQVSNQRHLVDTSTHVASRRDLLRPAIKCMRGRFQTGHP